MPRTGLPATDRLSEARGAGALVPLGIVLGWIGLELLLRRGLVPVLAGPLGSPFAADWAALAVGMPLIAVVLSAVALRSGQTPADWDYEVSLRTVGVGLAGVALAVPVVAVTGYVDGLLFGGAELSTFTGAVADAIAAEPALAALLLLGNGLLGPLAEEQVWRAVVQTDLVAEWGVAAGVGATALLFALKHVVVDASLARATTLVVLGLLLGLLRHRFGTASGAVAHVGLNSLTSGALVVAALG